MKDRMSLSMIEGAERRGELGPGGSVRDEDAFDIARKLARVEGIFGGITSGANVWAAIQQAKVLGRGKNIVTLIVDSGLKYLNGELYR